jgi:hypothetical protein
MTALARPLAVNTTSKGDCATSRPESTKSPTAFGVVLRTTTPPFSHLERKRM